MVDRVRIGKKDAEEHIVHKLFVFELTNEELRYVQHIQEEAFYVNQNRWVRGFLLVLNEVLTKLNQYVERREELVNVLEVHKVSFKV